MPPGLTPGLGIEGLTGRSTTPRSSRGSEVAAGARRRSPPSPPATSSASCAPRSRGRATSSTIDATAIHAIHANMPRNATVPSDAMPATTPSQPSQAGSPARIAAIEAGTMKSAAATPAVPSRNQPTSS